MEKMDQMVEDFRAEKREKRRVQREKRGVLLRMPVRLLALFSRVSLFALLILHMRRLSSCCSSGWAYLTLPTYVFGCWCHPALFR